MRVERHVFGSVRGYGTLARGAGVTDADCRLLSSLSFGTPYDSAYPQSLNEKVAYWSRPLGSARRAVTRVLPGRPDDAGRPTLRFISAIVDVEDWNFTLRADAPALLRVRELWEWDGTPALAALDIPEPNPGSWRFSDESTHRILGLVSLVELAWRAKQPVIVRSDQYRLNEVATVERLLPPSVREHYSAVYRSLNPELPARLNCLSTGVPLGSTGASRFLAEAKSPYALELERDGFGKGEEPGLLLIGYEHFGGRGTQSGGKSAEGPNVNLQTGGAGRDARRGAAPMSMVVLLLSLLLVFLIGGAAGWLLGSSRGGQAKAAEDAWADCVLQTLDLPTLTREQQTGAIEDVRKTIDAPALAKSGRRIEVSDKLHRTADAVRLLKKAEDEIAIVAPDEAAAVRAGEQTIAVLAKERIGDVALLRDWLAARQRPLEDRYAVVADRLREKITPEMTELAGAAERVDPRAFEQARALRHTLNLIESATSDRPEPWVGDAVARLDGWLRDWKSKLDSVTQQSQQMQASEQSRQQEQKEMVAARLQELKGVLTAGKTTPRRREVEAALRAVGRDGRVLWGEVFGQSIDALAEWLLVLTDVAYPEQLAELRKSAGVCETLAGNIETTSKQFNERMTGKETADLLRSMRMDANSLAVEAKKVQTLTEELVKP